MTPIVNVNIINNTYMIYNIIFLLIYLIIGLIISMYHRKYVDKIEHVSWIIIIIIFWPIYLSIFIANKINKNN